MATIADASAANQPRFLLVNFEGSRRYMSVNPGRAVQWGLVTLVVANLGRIPIASAAGRDATIVLNDVAVTLLAGFLVVTAIVRRSLLLDKVAIMALAFAGIGFGSAMVTRSSYALSVTQMAVSLSYLARWLTYFCVYLFVINNVRRGEVAGIWSSMQRLLFVFTAFGVLQSFFLPDFAFIVYPQAREYYDWDPQGHRLVSTVLDPNIAAAMILLVLLVQLAMIASGAAVKRWVAAVLILGLTLTLSRSGLLALCGGLVVIALARGISLRLIRLLGVILFFAIAFIPQLLSFAQQYARFSVGAGTSAGTRIAGWTIALLTIAKHPVIGVGFNTYGYVKESMGLTIRGVSSFTSDGGLLFAAVMTGVAGLVCYVAMLWLVVRRCRRIWRNPDQDAGSRGIAIGVAAGVVAITIHSVFANSLFSTFVMELMWVLWGMTHVIARNAPHDMASRAAAGA
jgi:O-antigen ligase